MSDEWHSGARDARPRLLVLASTYPRWPGDPEPGFVHELSKRLADRFRVVALVPHAPGAKPREAMDGVDVIRYRYAPEALETLVNDGGIVTNLRRAKWKLLLVPTFVFAQAWMAWRLVSRGRIDAIHAHWLLPQGLIAALLQSLPGKRVPFLATAHGSDVQALRGRVMSALRRLVVRRASVVAVVSRVLRAKLGAEGANTAKLAVLPMGVDLTGRFVPDVGVSRSDNEILFVGRLVGNKGVEHLLDAMPRVLRCMPNARVAIVGSGPLKSTLVQQVERLGLSAAVSFLGAVPQPRLPDLYRRAALLVAPFGKKEGLGLVLVEAVGCGCPVLAGDAPAVADVLGGVVGEMTVDPRDTSALAERIVAILADPAAARARASELRETIIGRFDWERVADGYRQLLAQTN